MQIEQVDPGALQDVESRMHRLIAHGRGGAAAPGDVLTSIAAEHLRSGGKRLRARLALAATAALGGSAPWGLAWAAACELAHNATLIHDDLQDGDELRRGQPTTWRRHGAAQAINAGDLLLMLPFAAVQQATDEPAAPLAGRLQHALTQHLVAVIRGQAAECALTAGGVATRASYRTMVAQKTAALFELPVHGAALIAGHSVADAAALAAPFAPLGTLFQMQDDVLDLFGDKGRAAPGSDLREGKFSALVVEHLELHPQDRDWLLALLRRPRAATDAAMVQEATRRFADGGALRQVLGDIQALRQEAEVGVDGCLRGLLQELLARVMEPIGHLF